MGMGDCEGCWDTLCSCGTLYQTWTAENLEDLIITLKAVRAVQKRNPDTYLAMPNKDFRMAVAATADEIKRLKKLKEEVLGR